MINFAVDISDTIQEFQLQPAEITSVSDYLLDRMVDEVMGKWETIINANLHGTRDEYKRGMYTERPNDNTAIIGLNGRENKLAMMIEGGASVFDIKQGFERSEKRTEKEDGGWYLTIPFRHATSESIMDMQVPGMKSSVLDFMKQGNTMEQSTLPAPFDKIQTHSMSLNTGSILTYVHKAPIYEGMHRKDISSTQKEKRGGYMTFRRVSDKSDESSWMHPGFVARDFMGQAMQEADLSVLVDNAIQDWLDAKFSK